MAIALLIFYVQTTIPVGLISVIIAHCVFNIALLSRLWYGARLQGYDNTLEEAARDLGANEWQTFWRITFPLIAPGIIGGALLAFTLSIRRFCHYLLYSRRWLYNVVCAYLFVAEVWHHTED